MRTHHSIGAFPNKKPGRPNRQKHCLYGHVRKVRSSNFIHCATRAAIFSGLSHPFRPFACTEQQRSTIGELVSLLVPSCATRILCVSVLSHTQNLTHLTLMMTTTTTSTPMKDTRVRVWLCSVAVLLPCRVRVHSGRHRYTDTSMFRLYLSEDRVFRRLSHKHVNTENTHHTKHTRSLRVLLCYDMFGVCVCMLLFGDLTVSASPQATTSTAKQPPINKQNQITCTVCDSRSYRGVPKV